MIMILNDGVRPWLSGELDSLINWRKTKAAQHPEDSRNHRAVDVATKLLSSLQGLPEQPKELELTGLAKQWFDRSNALELIPDPLLNEVSTFWRDIGFNDFPASINELCSGLCGVVETALDQHPAPPQRQL